MLDRLESIGRVLCIGLGVLLFLQLVNAILNGDPLRHATIPELPTYAAATHVETNSVKPTPGTNSVKSAKPARAPRNQIKNSNLPGPVQAQVDAVTQSEILAPFMHPLPMALLGIAGDDAFLRAPSGQTGMIKEGGELGEIKLLRIGVNRVLVEEDGEKKELMLFDGVGGESLLSPEMAINSVRTNVPTSIKTNVPTSIKTNVSNTKKEDH
jgi:hypothetical protein